MATPCDDCVAGCCREYHILPSGHDVVRIAEALALPLESFVTLRSRPAENGAFRIVVYDPQGQPLYHRMELGKRAEPEADYAARCVFLLTVGGRGRCGIYGVRPALCAAYPTNLREGILTLGRVRPYCPKGSWQLADVDVPAHRIVHATMDTQAIISSAVIDAWNQHVQLQTELKAQQASAFFAFLHRAYNLLREREPTLFAEGPAESSTESKIGHAALPRLVAARLADLPCLAPGKVRQPSALCPALPPCASVPTKAKPLWRDSTIGVTHATRRMCGFPYNLSDVVSARAAGPVGTGGSAHQHDESGPARRRHTDPAGSDRCRRPLRLAVPLGGPATG